MNKQQTDLILANSQWEALYRKAMEDLKNADEVIRRIGNRCHEAENQQTRCSCCDDIIINNILCRDCLNYQESQKFSGRPVRSTCIDTTNELLPCFEIGEAQDLYYEALGETENAHYAAIDESAEDRPMVDLQGNVIRNDEEEEMPEWMNDATSFWKMPKPSALEAIAETYGYETPPATPHVKTTPPQLERKKKIYPEVNVYPHYCTCENVYPHYCTCERCKYVKN